MSILFPTDSLKVFTGSKPNTVHVHLLSNKDFPPSKVKLCLFVSQLSFALFFSVVDLFKEKNCFILASAQLNPHKFKILIIFENKYTPNLAKFLF